MRERCLQSLAILLAGLFSAERARERERAQAERKAASGLPPCEPKPGTPNVRPLTN